MVQRIIVVLDVRQMIGYSFVRRTRCLEILVGHGRSTGLGFWWLMNGPCERTSLFNVDELIGNYVTTKDI